MRNINKPIMFAITFVIAGLVLTSAASIVAIDNVKNVAENKIVRTVKQDKFLEMLPNPIQLESKHTLSYVSNGVNPSTIGTDVPLMIYPEENDIENVNLLDNSGNTILAIAEAHLDVTTVTPFVRYSNDGGDNWLPEDDFLTWQGMEGYIEEQPCIDYAGDNGGFGSMIPIEPLYLVTLDFDDISDPDAGDQWGLWSWLTDEEIDSVDVCGVNSEFAPDPYARGMVVRTGDDVSGKTNILYIGWREGEDTLRGLWTGNGDLTAEWENVDTDIDLVTGNHFEAYEILDDATLVAGVELDWCQMDGTGDWWTNNPWYWTGGIIEDATNPDVKADNGYVYLVYEFNGGITCLYSTDNAQNFNEVQITDLGQLPSITAIGETAVCSYTRDGDLFTSISEDGGATWSEETQVNDVDGTVVEQQNNHDVSGSFIAWTDSRDSNQNNIYFDIALQIGSPPTNPIISGPNKFKPNEEKSFTFTATDTDGDQIYYYVDWGDGTNSGWQGPVASGTAKALTHTWTTKAIFTIKCKAKDVNSMESGWSEFKVSTPRFGGLSLRFLDYFQHTFPYLCEMLGL